MSSHLFHCVESENLTGACKGLDARYSCILWQPKIRGLIPRGLPIGYWRVIYVFLWLIHRLHLFGNRDCGALLVYDGESLVHQTLILPRFFRFPFMANADLQLSTGWTSNEHRGQGIASFAFETLLHSRKRPGRRFWAITALRNKSPIVHVLAKVGFRQVATGRRKNRFGLRILGYFAMDHQDEELQDS